MLLLRTLQALLVLSGLSAAMAVAAGLPSNAVQILHPPLTEISGIIKSQRYDNVFWVLNDSGDEARIFAIRRDGSVVIPAYLQDKFFSGKPVAGKEAYPGVQITLAANNDWEEITLDGDTLFISDMGNNGNARRDLGVYVLPEPNPEATTRSRPLKWLPIEYPTQSGYPGAEWHFDCEAVFVMKGKLYFLTKHRASGQFSTPATGSDLYRLDSAFTDKMNVLKKVDSHPDLKGWVTGAALSPDGKNLAVLCEGPLKCVWLFDVPRSGDKLLSGKARRLLIPDARQCEGLCFEDNDSILVTNEQRDMFSVNIADFSPVER